MYSENQFNEKTWIRLPDLANKLNISTRRLQQIIKDHHDTLESMCGIYRMGPKGTWLSPEVRDMIAIIHNSNNIQYLFQTYTHLVQEVNFLRNRNSELEELLKSAETILRNHADTISAELQNLCTHKQEF